MRREATKALARRLHLALEENDLPAGSDPDLLAEFLTTLAIGLKVGSVDGVTCNTLEQIAVLALTAWPAQLAPKGS